jgi:dihydrofolate reductase
MSNVVITTNTTLDGVVQDPDGQEGFESGGWFRQFGGKDLEEWTRLITEEARQATALLLGRQSEAWFGQRWKPRTGELADILNGLPKYVVSSSLAKPRWTNTRVLNGELASDITRLKSSLDGEILVYASYQLGQALLKLDLVDELRLFVFPVVLGAGKRLFGSLDKVRSFRLREARAVGESLVLLTYDRLR